MDESDTSAPPGWLKGTCNGKTGLFPANYGEKLHPDTFNDYVDLDSSAKIMPSQQAAQILESAAPKPKPIAKNEAPKPIAKDEVPKPIAASEAYSEVPIKPVAQPRKTSQPQPQPKPTNKPIQQSVPKPTVQPKPKGTPGLQALRSISNASSTSDSGKEVEAEDIYSVPPSGFANFESVTGTPASQPALSLDVSTEWSRQSYENVQFSSSPSINDVSVSPCISYVHSR